MIFLKKCIDDILCFTNQSYVCNLTIKIFCLKYEYCHTYENMRVQPL